VRKFLKRVFEKENLGKLQVFIQAGEYEEERVGHAVQSLRNGS